MGAVLVLLVVHLLFTAAYAGFQWTVQVVVYRQFGLVPAALAGVYALRPTPGRLAQSFGVPPLMAASIITGAFMAA